MSGGQKRKLSVAIALIGGSKVHLCNRAFLKKMTAIIKPNLDFSNIKILMIKFLAENLNFSMGIFHDEII